MKKHFETYPKHGDDRFQKQNMKGPYDMKIKGWIEGTPLESLNVS